MLFRTLTSIIIAGPVLTAATPPPPAFASITNLTTALPPSALDARADTWGGFFDNNCYDITYTLSEADNDKDEKKNTIEPYLESPLLTARCWDLVGNEKCSSLELGDCLMNRGGILKPAEGGAFHRSCSYCRLTDGGRKMHCFCYPDHARSPQVYSNEVNLNDFIHNFNGQLRCFGSMASYSDCPSGDSYDPTKGNN